MTWRIADLSSSVSLGITLAHAKKQVVLAVVSVDPGVNTSNLVSLSGQQSEVATRRILAATGVSWTTRSWSPRRTRLAQSEAAHSWCPPTRVQHLCGGNPSGLRREVRRGLQRQHTGNVGSLGTDAVVQMD